MLVGVGLAKLLYALTRLDPRDTEVAREYVTVLLAQGRRGDATRHCRQFRRRLEREFGGSPGFTLQDLRLPAVA